MGRLFWKIFIWYWLTAVTLVVLTAWATQQVARPNRSDDIAGVGPSHARATLRVHRAMQRTSALLARGEMEAAATVVEGMQRRLFVVDDAGEDLLGRSLPRPVRAWRDGRGARVGNWLVRNVASPSGDHYTLIARFPPQGRPGEPAPRDAGSPVGAGAKAVTNEIQSKIDPGRAARAAGSAKRPGEGRRRDPSALRPLLGPPRVREYWWVRLLVALALSGVVCYLLTRYLLRPLHTLGVATRRVAAGELGTRIGPSLGRRRDEIVDLAHDFDHMAERIASLLTSKERLLRDVAHELRSPLARLRVALELARSRADGRADSEHDRIELEAERLGDLIAQILTLEELTRPLQAQECETVALGELIREVCEDANFEAGGSDVEVRARVHLERDVRGDRRQLRSAVENVVRNACKYSGAGTVVSVSLDAGADPSGARIEVADLGPGVAPDTLPLLFDPFYRTDDARSREHGGYGLGLAIAARIVGRHGGHIEAANRGDGARGLRVTIQLPGAASGEPATGTE